MLWSICKQPIGVGLAMIKAELDVAFQVLLDQDMPAGEAAELAPTVALLAAWKPPQVSETSKSQLVHSLIREMQLTSTSARSIRYCRSQAFLPHQPSDGRELMRAVTSPTCKDLASLWRPQRFWLRRFWRRLHELVRP